MTAPFFGYEMSWTPKQRHFHGSAAMFVVFPSDTALTPWHGASWQNQVKMEPFSLLQILLCHRLSPALARGRATVAEPAWGRKG